MSVDGLLFAVAYLPTTTSHLQKVNYKNPKLLGLLNKKKVLPFKSKVEKKKLRITQFILNYRLNMKETQDYIFVIQYAQYKYFI